MGGRAAGAGRGRGPQAARLEEGRAALSTGINLAQLETQAAAIVAGNDLAGLRAGATGQPAVTAAAELLREQRYQREQRTLDDSTPLARDAAEAYREVMGDRRQRQPSRSTSL